MSVPSPAPSSSSRIPARTWFLAGWSALAVALVSFGTARADDPQADPLLVTVQAAVAAGHTQNTPPRGFHNARRTFTEVPQAGVLIGLECGVGKWMNIETVYAVRAIYQTAKGVQFAQEHGLFADRVLGPKKTAKSQVLRRVRVQAPEGYAVGGITVRSGLNINGLSLTFMKANGTVLMPSKSVVSPWVGDRTGGSEGYVGANGAPVVGIHGSQDDTHVQSLGLVFVTPPAPKAQDLPLEIVPVIPPVPAAPPVAPPMAPPAAPPVAPPAAAPPGPPPAPPVAANDPGPHPPRPGADPVPAAKPAPAPAPAPDAEPAAEAMVAPAEPVDAAAKAPPAARRSSGWVAYLVFGLVGVLVFGGSLAFIGVRKLMARGQPAPPAPRRAKAVPPPLPADEPTDPSAAAIRAAPPAVSPAPAPVSLPDVPPAREEEPIVLLPQDAVQAGAPRVPESPSVRIEEELPATIATGPESRGATRVCGRCDRLIPAELGRAPWCPYCGGDLKPSVAIPAAADPVAASPASGATPPPLLQPPYFIGRVTHTHRVYVLPDKLLFLYAPALEDESGTERVIKGVSVTGGLLGAAIGGMIAGTIAGQRRSRTHDRSLKLDLADTQELIDLAAREPESFRIDVDDLHAVRIEAPGLCQHLFGTGCAARFYFRTVERGEVTVELPRPDDVGVAIKQLTAMLGDRLDVNATWDWGKNRFVPKA